MYQLRNKQIFKSSQTKMILSKTSIIIEDKSQLGMHTLPVVYQVNPAIIIGQLCKFVVGLQQCENEIDFYR